MLHRIIRSWYTGHWWVGCYIRYSKEEPGTPGWAAAPPRPLLTVPNVTAHPSMANVPMTALLHDSPLLCGFNVAIKGLIANLLQLHCSYIGDTNRAERVWCHFQFGKCPQKRNQQICRHPANMFTVIYTVHGTASTYITTLHSKIPHLRQTCRELC